MSGERAAATLRERPPSVPKPPSTFALVALAVALGVAAAAFAAAEAVRRAMAGGGIGSFIRTSPAVSMCSAWCSRRRV